MVDFLPTGLAIYLSMAHSINLPPNHYWSCRLAITLSFMSSLCSILFIINMTFDRFFSIIKPHKAASFNTLKRAKLTIVCIVIFSTLYNIPHLFISSNQGHIYVPYGSVSGPMVQFYYWLSFVIHFAFPFISLVIMNSFIIRAIHESFKVKGKQIKGVQGQGEGQIKSSETQVYATLLLVTFAFLTFATPAYVFFFYVMFFDYTKSAYRFAGFHLFYNVAQKLHYTNYGINFFLYVISGGKFRADLIKLFKSWRHPKYIENSTHLSSLSE